MDFPTFDAEGYPTEETLDAIREWKDDYHALLHFVRAAWQYGDYWWSRVGKGGTYYRLATGGWSGNESLLQALQDNFVFWALCWQMSKRGGLSAFFVTRKENS